MGERVIVVGAGVMGLSSAHHLVRRGFEVVVLEGEAGVGLSASGGNAGILAFGHLPLPRPGLARKAVRWMLDPESPLYVPPRWDPALWAWFLAFQRACNAARVRACMDTLGPLGRLALAEWRDLADRCGFAGGLRPVGWLNVYRTEAGRREAEHEADEARRYGFLAESLDAAALAAQEPAFAGGVLGAVHYPESIGIDPPACMRALAAGLQADGVEIRTGAAVERLLVKDGRCLGVRLRSGEEMVAGSTILAAGVWSDGLSRQAGLRLPQQGGKGYHLDLEHPPVRLKIPAVLTEVFVAVNPLPDRLRLAGTVEFSGTNRRLRRRRLEMLARGAEGWFVGLEGARRLGEGCDLRPCLADGLLAVGRAPRVRDLFILAGGAKVGMTLGPVCGRLVAACLAGEEPPIDMKPLDPGRF